MAGTGTTAVSRFFTGRGYLGEETKKKIEEVVRKTNFRINRAASLLKSQITRQIAMIIPFGETADIYTRQYFMNEKFSAAMMETFRRDYELLLLPAHLSDEAGIGRFEKSLRLHNFSGALFFESVSARVLDFIRQIGIPYVLSNFNTCRDEEGRAVDFKEGEPNGVLTDYPGVLEMIFDFAKKGGYKTVTLWGFEGTVFDYETRLSALYHKSKSGNAGIWLKNLLNKNHAGEGTKPSGRVLFAIRGKDQVLDFHRKFSSQLGKDWGLLAFDRHPEFELLRPSPSVISQEVERIGAESVSVLIGMIEEKKRKVPSRIIPARILERGTTNPAS